MEKITELRVVKIDKEVLTRSKNLLIVRFLLYTGLRLGDAATARTDQIDWQEKTLTRTMAKTSRPVTFPLHPDLFRRLQADNTYLFPAMAKQYRKAPSAITLRFRRLFATLGITGEKQQYCAHCLRTTFASICAENEIPLPVIQSWLGHSSPTVTRIYARIEDMRAKKAALTKFPTL
jgi:integrase